jgi:hypothetical protein
MNTPTTGVSKLLDRLIRPLFDKRIRSTTVFDGVVTDLYTKLPQEESLNGLTEFLLEHGYHKVKGVPIDAIRKLARIVLTENVFVYKKKFYRQILGDAMGSAFTLTLADIFMWKWEKKLVRLQEASNEIYGRCVSIFIDRSFLICNNPVYIISRYIDDIIFTSIESLSTINQIVDEANNFHPNIQLVRHLGRVYHFLMYSSKTRMMY